MNPFANLRPPSVRRSRYEWLWVCLVAMGGSWLGPATAAAGGVVQDCSAASLRASIAGGGLVTLACDGTITLTETIEITTDTVLEGFGRAVVLSGGGKVRLFRVVNGATLQLRNLTLSQGRHEGGLGAAGPGAAEGGGAAVLVERGRLVAEKCSFLDHLAQGGDAFPAGGNGGAALGGAVRVRGGDAAFFDCQFQGNRAKGGPEVVFSPPVSGFYGSGMGGAIHVDGVSTLRLVRSRFSANLASGQSGSFRGGGGSAWGGAVYCASGAVEVHGCTFAANRVAPGDAPRGYPAGDAAGGAVYLDAAVNSAAITESVFEGNEARGGLMVLGSQPVGGGALYSGAPLRCELSTFLKNRAIHTAWAEARGGAILATHHLSLENCVLSENVAQGGVGGGANRLNGFAGFGGGVCVMGAASMTGCSFDGNQARGGDGNAIPGQSYTDGGPGVGGAVYSMGSLAMTNCTLYRNHAEGGAASTTFGRVPGGGGGGGIGLDGGSFDGVHLTVMENSARAGRSDTGDPISPGVGRGGGIRVAGMASARLANSVVADSTAGDNCLGLFVESTRNLSSDRSCGFATRGGWDDTAPRLGPYTLEGGPTPTMIPVEGSVTVDAADPAKCPATDQRGVVRPAGSGCEVGAYELVRTASVKGSVRGLPAGVQARVRAGHTFGLTDLDGTYVLLSVPPGTNDLGVSAEGYRFWPGTVRRELGDAVVSQDFDAYPVNTLWAERTALGAWRFRFAGPVATSWVLERSPDLSAWTVVGAYETDGQGWIEAELAADPVGGEVGYFRMRRP